MRDESSSPVQSRKNHIKHGKARKRIDRRDNEDKAITHGGWRSWFNRSNFSNPMQIFDKQTGYREALLHKKYIEKEKCHHESIAQAEKRFNQINSIAKLEIEAAYLREQIESGASMQTSSGITTSPSYIANSSQNDKDSTHAVHDPKTIVQQATESAHQKSASINAKPAVTHQEPESTHQEPAPDHQEPNAVTLPFNAIPQTPSIETPRPALPSDTARKASQLDVADFSLPARPIRNQARGVNSRKKWTNRNLGGPSLLTRLRRQQQFAASDSVGGSNNDVNNSRGSGDKGKGKNEPKGDGKIEGNIGVKVGGKDGAETDAKDGNKDDRKADQHDGKNDDGDESDNDDAGENDAKGGGKVAASSGPTNYQANPTEHATNDFLMDVDSAPTPAQNKGPSSSFQNQPTLLQSLVQLPLPSFGQIPDVDAVGDDSVMADGSAAEGAAVENNDDDQAQTGAMQAELDAFFDQQIPSGSTSQNGPTRADTSHEAQGASYDRNTMEDITASQVTNPGFLNIAPNYAPLNVSAPTGQSNQARGLSKEDVAMDDITTTQDNLGFAPQHPVATHYNNTTALQSSQQAQQGPLLIPGLTTYNASHPELTAPQAHAQNMVGSALNGTSTQTLPSHAPAPSTTTSSLGEASTFQQAHHLLHLVLGLRGRTIRWSSAQALHLQPQQLQHLQVLHL